MKKKIKYTDDPMQIGKILPRNFLPPIEKLIFKEKRAKVVIELEKSSLDFFKREAKKRKSSPQRIIRNIITSYARTKQIA